MSDRILIDRDAVLRTISDQSLKDSIARNIEDCEVGAGLAAISADEIIGTLLRRVSLLESVCAFDEGAPDMRQTFRQAS